MNHGQNQESVQATLISWLSNAGQAEERTGLIVADLESFFVQLTKWQRVQNLVSRETLSDFWLRHALDSLQILPHISDDTQHIVDFGSGGGFPVIPLSIALKDRPVTLHALESNQRKCSFLRTVARDLELRLAVLDGRIEDASLAHEADLFTSRAAADLTTLFDWAWPLWTAKSRALFHKGRKYREEVADAQDRWTFDVVEIESLTEPGAAILDIRNLAQK